MIDGRKMYCKMPVKLLLILMIAAMLLVLQAAAGYAEEKGGSQGEEKIFKDVSLTDANAPYIKFLFKKGLMSGYPDGSFGPGRPLTRAEAVIVLAKGAGIKPVTPAAATFKDAGPGHWAYGYIEAAVKAGILSGYPDGTFCPDAQLSRAETMALLIKWSKQDTSDVSLTIKDVTKTNWAYKAVCTAVDANFIALAADGNFNPDQAITRRDFARGTAMTMALSPGYNAVSLKGELVVKKGSLKVKTAAGEQTVTDRLTLQEGMQINTLPRCDAEIVFEDGSGIKIMENTEIILRKLGGVQTIRKDGMPITAIDNVDIKLNSGKIFGALASKYDSQQNKDNKEDKSKLIASTELTPELYKSLLALEQPKSSQQQLPWYKVASTKKVKVTVDMPWGVAAVRGTFWSNEVGLKELITSVLNGEMTLTTTGGQTVTISGGQMTTVDSAGGPPTPPAPMPPEVAQAWQALQDWVTQRANEIQNNQLADFEAPPGDLNNEQAPATEQLQTLVQTLTTAIDNAISNANTNTNTNTNTNPSSGGSGGSDNDDNATIADGWELTGLWRVVNNNSGIYNKAVNKYVALPPGDNTGGMLPNSPSGAGSFWYGKISDANEYAVGNYLNEQKTDDGDSSGGTSLSGHKGRLISPVFSVPTTESGMIPVVKFNSWWEIESIDPAHFDRMSVYVNVDGEESLLGSLNPLTAPYGQPSLPYTSAGFNMPASWKTYTFDLTGYEGKNIRLCFEFDTVDEEFNAFRGWLISQVEVVETDQIEIQAPMVCLDSEDKQTIRVSEASSGALIKVYYKDSDNSYVPEIDSKTEEQLASTTDDYGNAYIGGLLTGIYAVTQTVNNVESDYSGDVIVPSVVSKVYGNESIIDISYDTIKIAQGTTLSQLKNAIIIDDDIDGDNDGSFKLFSDSSKSTEIMDDNTEVAGQMLLTTIAGNPLITFDYGIYIPSNSTVVSTVYGYEDVINWINDTDKVISVNYDVDLTVGDLKQAIEVDGGKGSFIIYTDQSMTTEAQDNDKLLDPLSGYRVLYLKAIAENPYKEDYYTIEMLG